MDSAIASTEGALVLVIDDEEIIRQIYVKLLDMLGYRSIEAENGRCGLEQFHAQNPDMVLVDLNMPEIGGIEVLKSITKAAPEVPVIIVSGTTNVQDAIRALRFGAWDFLLKPSSAAIFKHTINRCLERANLIRQNREFRHQLEQRLKSIYEDEEAGRIIQACLLPPPSHEFGPYSISYALIPSMYLSGDFIDFFELGQDRFAFYLADVSGHGISSALITVFLNGFMVRFRERMKHQNDDTICHPAKLLVELNEELLNQKLDKHMTLFFGIIDTTQGTLSYVDAGQYPKPLLITEETVTPLLHKSLPIGLFDFTTYETQVIDLPPRFQLTIFSDGILDILSDMSLEDKLEKLEHLACTDSAAAQLKEAESGGELPDDITVLTIKGNRNG